MDTDFLFVWLRDFVFVVLGFAMGFCFCKSIVNAKHPRKKVKE